MSLNNTDIKKSNKCKISMASCLVFFDHPIEFQLRVIDLFSCCICNWIGANEISAKKWIKDKNETSSRLESF